MTIQANAVSVGYRAAPVVQEVSLRAPAGSFTAILGPNGSGKSTLLRGLGRILPLAGGSVEVAGKPLDSFAHKEFAREVAFLPQSPVVPDQVTVRELVGRGRFPHHGLWRPWAKGDGPAIDQAMAVAGVTELAAQRVAELSGGQQQRVWLALVLAQQTPALLLDEPTTFLDIAHQYEVLDLCRDLAANGRAVVAVLHDLDQAARYADQLIVLDGGRVAATGTPAEVLTTELMDRVFGLSVEILVDPDTARPMLRVLR
ncbi:hypothetical protein CGZ95_16530 [Enemella evansiae]|uniref:ABC transporter ATP-binding protein n=1 Tax=Enemella evansiae TaxID=2016499 RepID=UPI000B966540|nr:ABC transporter ATP-binding protein [Enemella evansiae]OYN95341.1 hypothetical protein CGZ95_16530 [Enemella evansiae]